MMVGVLVLLAALAYLNLADSAGSAKVAEFYGNQIAHRELVLIKQGEKPAPVVVFGVPALAPERKE